MQPYSLYFVSSNMPNYEYTPIQWLQNMSDSNKCHSFELSVHHKDGTI